MRIEAIRASIGNHVVLGQVPDPHIAGGVIIVCQTYLDGESVYFVTYDEQYTDLAESTTTEVRELLATN